MSLIVQVRIPENISLSLQEPSEKIELEMKRALAVIYYSDGMLSLRQCAELAEMSNAEFVRHLFKYKISIFKIDSEEELFVENDKEVISTQALRKSRREAFGCLKGKINVPDDFNDPLDDFVEYM